MIIYLFSPPSDLSTALMYAFNQRPDTLTMDEPFYGIWLKNTSKKQAFHDEVMLRMECDDANKVHDQIEENESVKGNVFVKITMNTVPYVNENRLSKSHHILLINDPAETIVSHSISEPPLTSTDLCLEDQIRIYDWLKSNTREDPILVDSNELKQSPDTVLKKICNRLKLPYTNKMLSWPSGPKSIDGFWTQSAYSKVHASIGFHSLSWTQVTRENIPKNLMTLYDAALPDYEKLLSNCI